jgi:hypothetical protein
MKIFSKKLWSFVKRFFLTTYGVLFLCAYVSWIVVGVDTSNGINSFWGLLMIFFAPLITLLVKVNEVLVLTDKILPLPKTGEIYWIAIALLIASFLFLLDLLLLSLRTGSLKNFLKKTYHKFTKPKK